MVDHITSRSVQVETPKTKNPTLYLGELRLQILQRIKKKSRIRETKNLSTDADSRTVTVSERLHDLFKKNK